MFKELKFVQGAVAKKDFIPAITHFAIENGHVRAFNGTIALSSPIACDLNCKPKAIPMVQAIGRCQDTITLAMTPAGRLSIKSGSFKAFIDCVEETQAHVEPEGEIIHFNGEEVLKALKVISPFIGSDASRPWTNGVLLKGQSAYATNNVCVIEYWLAADFPIVVNIPKAAIVEMIRINEPPTHAQVTELSITFHYGDGRWIRSQLFDTGWADLDQILNVESNSVPIPDDLFTGLEIIKPFVTKYGQVYITPHNIRTHPDISEGASYDIKWALADSLFNNEMLLLLQGVATSADFTSFPKPCMFFGERLRGAIIGMRL